MRSMNKKEYNKKYYKAHRDKMLAHMKQYYKAHQDEELAYQKQWYETHRDEIAVYKKQWYEQNKDKCNQRAKAWRENHIEQYREIDRKHNSKRYRQFGFIPLNEWFEGSEAHHICATFVIYIPKELHRSIWHSLFNNVNMEKINTLAWEELYKQRATNTFQCI